MNAAGGASPDAAAGKPAEPGRPDAYLSTHQLIPSKYNGETTLTAEVKERRLRTTSTSAQNGS